MKGDVTKNLPVQSSVQICHLCLFSSSSISLSRLGGDDLDSHQINQIIQMALLTSLLTFHYFLFNEEHWKSSFEYLLDQPLILINHSLITEEVVSRIYILI